MEKVSILSLSLILTTAFSISSAQSAMFAFYKEIPESWVELLVSLPSAGIMLMLLFNRVIEKYLTERQMIVSGLLIFSLCGLLPLLSQSYWLMFASRIVFGMGIGLLNAKAISIVSERYKGQERVRLLGLRGSAEVVGTAFLTFGVSLLLPLGWQAAFLVYTFGLVVKSSFCLCGGGYCADLYRHQCAGAGDCREVWHGDTPNCRHDSFLDAVDWDCSGHQLCQFDPSF